MPSDLLDSKNLKDMNLTLMDPMTSFEFHHSTTSSPFSLINLSSTKTPAPSLDFDHPMTKRTTSRTRKKFAIGNNALNKDIENLEEIQHINKGRWTNDEHTKFTQAIEMFPKGVLHRWRKVSDWVGSRTVLQTRTHAQKYFKTLAKPVIQKHTAPAVAARQDSPLGSSTTRQSRIMGVAIGLLDMKSQSQTEAGLTCENITESELAHRHTIDVILEEPNMATRIENDPGPEYEDFHMEPKSTPEGPASGAWMMSSFDMSSNLSAIWPSSESPQNKDQSIMSTPIFSKEDRIPSLPSCTSLALRSTSKLQVRVLISVFILDGTHTGA